MSRYAILREIEQLDPVKDHQRIVYLVGVYEFPFEVQRSLEFALFRTFAVPSISRLLDQTQQFAKAGQKRYDDTMLIMAEIAEHGYESERGRAAIRRMNQIHRRFDISNEDYLYVLSTFIFEPIRWNPLLAWRSDTENERLANFYFWCEVGKLMNIRDIPETYEAYEAFNIRYEREHFRYSETNRRVGEASVEIFTHWFPGFLHPLVRWGIYALLDEPLRAAFGFPKMPGWWRWLVRRVLRLRAAVIRLLPPRRKPYSASTFKTRTYPNGYVLEQLGPEAEDKAVEPPNQELGEKRER